MTTSDQGTRQIIHPAEVRKALRDVRRYAKEVELAMARADLNGAYAAAESAQHAAFDAKALLQNGGKYERDAPDLPVCDCSHPHALCTSACHEYVDVR